MLFLDLNGIRGKKKASRDSLKEPRLDKNYVCGLLFESTHVIDDVPEVLIGNLILVLGHLSAAKFALVEMFAVCLGLVRIAS